MPQYAGQGEQEVRQAIQEDPQGGVIPAQAVHGPLGTAADGAGHVCPGDRLRAPRQNKVGERWKGRIQRALQRFQGADGGVIKAHGPWEGKRTAKVKQAVLKVEKQGVEARARAVLRQRHAQKPQVSVQLIYVPKGGNTIIGFGDPLPRAQLDRKSVV